MKKHFLFSIFLSAVLGISQVAFAVPPTPPKRQITRNEKQVAVTYEQACNCPASELALPNPDEKGVYCGKCGTQWNPVIKK